jgi:hypothetical protein
MQRGTVPLRTWLGPRGGAADAAARSDRGIEAAAAAGYRPGAALGDLPGGCDAAVLGRPVLRSGCVRAGESSVVLHSESECWGRARPRREASSEPGRLPSPACSTA